jgi:hypothetical protein
LLTAFVKALAAEFCRVALFRVKGNRLQGHHQLGFELTRDITKVVMPLSIDSLLTRAAASGEIEAVTLTATESADASHAPFGGTPSYALALPVVVHGETLAIVYADDSGQAEKKGAPVAHELRGRFAALLLQHASALLMQRTTELKKLAELGEYATMLLKEIEQMYAADADAGKKGADLRKRLKENLECARRMYAQRVEMEGPSAAALLEEQLVALVEARGDTPFSRDLATTGGVANPARDRASRTAAEAS